MPLDEPARDPQRPHRDDLELTAVLHALSDPQRLRVVGMLSADGVPRPCGSFGLEVTKSTASHHFRVLREAGVIEQRQQGTARLNLLRRDDLDARFPGLLEAVLAGAHVPAPVA
jgi:DNA-binding transcriptional ArsR family regulator